MKSLVNFALVGALILLVSTPAQAKIQIEHIQACYGP